MLSFEARGQVSEICNEELRVINGYEYKVIKLRVGKSLELYAYLDARKEISIGEHITSDSVYLTNHDDVRTPQELALRFGYFDVISADVYKPVECLEVRCNGKFIKSANATVREVGATKKKFLPCTLSIKNENDGVFNVLMVGTYVMADVLDQIKSNSYINVKAKLFNKLHEKGYELNVMDVDVVTRVR